MDILRIFVFTVLINWSISMQMLNQNLTNKKQKSVAVLLALMTAALAACSIVL
jgi:hypothetical protein